MPARFKIEDVATTPRGYRVRTVVRDGHRVRIAFPPGRRRRRSGKVVQILHPRNENPCRLPNPAELVVMMANPSQGKEASDLYEQFHGRQAQHLDEYDEPTPRTATLTELGDLLELRCKTDVGWKFRAIDFTGQGIKVASNATGTQLYFVGGNQRIGALGQFGADRSKELIDLGECRYIAYRTRKAHVNNIPSGYEHFLGEETGVYPRLMYDRRGREPRLYFTGGQYHVEAAGIVN